MIRQIARDRETAERQRYAVGEIDGILRREGILGTNGAAA
jgi:hypothetical protein